SARYLLMHELAHFLIDESLRTRSGLRRRAWAEQVYYGERQFDALEARGASATQEEWETGLIRKLYERIHRWKEEFFINETFIRRAGELNLKISEIQEIGAAMQRDFSHYFGRSAQILEAARLSADEGGAVSLRRALPAARKYLTEEK